MILFKRSFITQRLCHYYSEILPRDHIRINFLRFNVFLHVIIWIFVNFWRKSLIPASTSILSRWTHPHLITRTNQHSDSSQVEPTATAMSHLFALCCGDVPVDPVRTGSATLIRKHKALSPVSVAYRKSYFLIHIMFDAMKLMLIWG